MNSLENSYIKISIYVYKVYLGSFSKDNTTLFHVTSLERAVFIDSNIITEYLGYDRITVRHIRLNVVIAWFLSK